MRKILMLIITVLVICVLANAADDKGFTKLFNQYKSKQGCESVQIGKGMIKLISSNNEQLSGIEEILVLTVKNKECPQFENDIDSFLKRNPSLEIMASVVSDGEVINTYFEEGRNGKCVFLMNNQGKSETVVIYIYGSFNLQNVSDISKIVRK